jgi:outer membrane lipoprotein-sorting protein
MIHLKKIILLLVFIFICGSNRAQQPNKILNQVYAKLNKANNYSVDVNIKVDLPFIKMLPINAKIYFKQKDKFKVDSKSIAIVPKQGFVQLTKLINDTTAFTAMYQSSEIINGNKISLINVIPLSDTGDVVLGKLWIDEKLQVIIKSQITTKLNGTILTTYEYGKNIDFGLPDVMVFEVDIKKFKTPKAVAADINTTQKKEAEKFGKKGKIIIKLTNYLVNKGISDAVFNK